MSNSLIKVSQKHQHVIVKNAGGLQGKTGPKGDPGDVGPQGPSGTIAVGQTSTLPAGSQATVNNIGTPENAIFSFGIPKGDKGDRGEAGAGLQITGTVATYADLPNNLGPSDAGKAYFVQADGKLYVWTGTAFPADGQGTQFEGPQGPQGNPGPEGFSPIANVSKSGSTTTITLTDSQGTTTATVNDGTNINVNDSYSASTTEPYSANYVNTHTAQGTGPIGGAYQPVYLDNNNALQAGQSYADATFVGTTLSTPTNVAYVANVNIQDSAVTTAKIADGAVTSQKIDCATFVYGAERVIGQLQNGTLIYEQTITDTIPTYTTAGTVVKLGHIDNVDRIITMNGWSKRADYWTSMTQQYDTLKAAVQFCQRNGGGFAVGDITFLGDTAFSGIPYSLVVQYTKTS